MSTSRRAGGTVTLPVVDLFLPCAATSPRLARRRVAAECRAAGFGEEAVDSAELLTSEVVANAVLHGRSTVRLRVRADGRLVRVEVGDDNARLPTELPHDPAALGGRGLAIVAAVAARWGVDGDPAGKTVWFEIAA